VAMDVKGPRALWTNIAGRPDPDAAMLESMRLAAMFPDHEFRTTVVPVVRNGAEISFLTVQEIADTARLIAETTGGGGHKYYIQKFMPRKNGLLDPRLESFPETPFGLLENMKKEAAAHLPNCKIRG
jgi:hypothetical protein